MPLTKQLSVAAIENGTVIDHIPAGEALRIVRLLRLNAHKKKVTLGLNLPSHTLGYKDLIKVEEKKISPKEAEQIAIFAPKATINLIENYELVHKYIVQIPKQVEKIIPCPNARCITNFDPMDSLFYIRHFGQKIELQCKYCEKSFPHDLC